MESVGGWSENFARCDVMQKSNEAANRLKETDAPTDDPST